jgi:hypothetical protein
MSKWHSLTLASMARHVRPRGELHPLPFTVTGPTVEVRRRERGDALTLQDTPECDKRRSLRAITARFDIRLDVTFEFEFALALVLVVLLLGFGFVVEYRDVEEVEEEGVSFS